MKQKIEKLIHEFNGKVSLYVSDENNNELKINENEIVETASCIKLFVLIEYYRQIMNGEKSRKDKLVYNIKNDYVENGSGIIQYLEDGVTLSSKNMAILMIIISDNIATNKMIEYLGFDQINKTIKKLGFEKTELLAPKLDFSKYSKIGRTTAYEYAKIYKMLNNKKILNQESCNEILQILQNQKYNELLTKRLPPDKLGKKGKDDVFIHFIASKSGGLGDERADIINCRNDGGMISTKKGTYFISMFIYDFEDYYFYNDNPAILLGSEISRLILENFENNGGKFKF